MATRWNVRKSWRLEADVKVGINCGSGQRPFKSVFDAIQWINVDSQEKWNPDLVCDGAHLPYSDGHADYFVLHHVLEHFGCGEASGVIKEAHRVLKPGGSLIACVPEMRALAYRWGSGVISTQIFMTNVYGAYMGDEADRHKWGFDHDSLVSFLHHSAEWKSIKFFDFRELPGTDISHDWWILAMECVK
jgi:SAM-dependent methyltransferase